MKQKGKTSTLWWFLSGLPFILVCGFLIWIPNRPMFEAPSTAGEGVGNELPWSRSVVEFDKDVFSDAVSRSDWAELKGNVLRPKAGTEERFRATVDVNRCASILASEHPGMVEWNETEPSLKMPNGSSRHYIQVPTWVLWAFHDELQGL